MDPVGTEGGDGLGMGSEEDLVALVGEKRVMMEVDEGDDIDLGLGAKKKKNKKARIDDSSGDMKRVAEIVLVLSAMGKMRGGRSPTEVEKELMAEARKKLAEVCATMPPKDVIPSDAVRLITEDLGLNKSKDQRLGFRPPMKMSIAEKFLLAKKKMEESKKIVAPPTAYSPQRLQTGLGAKADNHSTSLHSVNRLPPGKSGAVTVPAGGFQATSPTVHFSALASSSSLKQFPASERQSAAVSRGLVSGPIEIKSSSPVLPRAEVPPFRLEGRLNGSVHASHVQVKSSSDLEKGPTTITPQFQSGALAGQSNKVPDHSVKAAGASEITSKAALQGSTDQNFKSPVTQTVLGNLHNVHQPSQATNFQQLSSFHTNHSDIAKNIQKLLQPRPVEHPNWTPPSTDYMSKSVTCQICKATINDVESLLVCDACENGVHLKCLQSYNHKGIPIGEWHCPQCLVSSNGKPLPPKYGRVTRNVSVPKASPNKSKSQASTEKVGSKDQKVNHQKITANGSTASQNPAHTGNTGSNNSGPASALMASTKEETGANFSTSINKPKADPASVSASLPKKSTGLVLAPQASKPNDSSIQHLQENKASPEQPERPSSEQNLLPQSQSQSQSQSDHSCPDKPSNTATDNSKQHLQSNSAPCHPERSSSELKSPLKSQSDHPSPDKPSDKGIDSPQQSQPECNLQDAKSEKLNHSEVSLKQHPQLSTSNIGATPEHNMEHNVRQDDREDAQTVSVGTSDVGNEAINCTRSSPDSSHSVDWVGDVLRVVDEKAFYRSCQINGIVYKLEDHALFRSNNEDLRPSKLQALWEDIKTGSKWATANRCYRPDDLPEVVIKPCTPECNEVYESNHGSTMRASLIQGACEVLSPNRFKKESERRSHMEHEANDGLRPIFLCRWLYDESKGLFQPVID